MSSNSQWKSFQTSTQDTINQSQNTNQSKSTTRNGNEFLSSSKDYLSSTGSNNRFSMGSFGADLCQMNDSIGTFGNNSSNNSSSQQYDPPSHPNRETGIIEKLLHSYGFIQCCERQARLFFHFSQFSGNIEHLKIGDPVEFEMTYDRRTGKPIASTVTKIAPEVVLSEARVTGTVTTELRGGEGIGDTTGRISYENRGECFFLPYTKDDVEGNVTLGSGDAVSFQIATNQRGNLGACHIRLENPVHPVKYQGVVCSMKESFGFIERADVVKEIFFHFSEAKIKNDLNLGDDVEFNIQTRNGKEVASNITRLPTGSVVFEDVCPEITKGQVLKSLERGNAARHQNDPLPGRIRYRAPDHSEVDVPFGDKDQSGEFTLRHGDWVQFQVATDRRDQLKRATNISLSEESFNVSGERREKGVVSVLKDGFGFIESVERDTLLFFHFTEVLMLGQTLNIGDEVEYTIDPATGFSNSRPSAIRIKHLPPGTVQFETILEKGVHGIVSKGASLPASNFLSSTQDANGLISYQSNGSRKNIIFYAKDVNSKILPREGDKVAFIICQVKRTKELVAMNVVVHQSTVNDSYMSNGSHPKYQGFIVALKDGFGFIETKEHDKEIFFHFSNLKGDVDALEVGKEVEYTIGRLGSSGSCSSAVDVKILPPGSIYIPQATGQILEGVVNRGIRALNPDQQQYSGMIEACNGLRYEYGVMGLAYKRECLRIGDNVTFQVDTENRATNIVAHRKKRRATVYTIQGNYGYLSFEVEDHQKLKFYMSDVRGSSNSLQPGDTVEFTLMIDHLNGKSSACNVAKISTYDTSHDMENGKDSDFASHKHNSFDGSDFSTVTGFGQRPYDQFYGNSNKTYKHNSTTEQSHYTDNSNGGSYEYGMPNFGNKRDMRVCDNINSASMRKKKRATVESIKGGFGFLSAEVEEGKKTLFYMTEVRGCPGSLQPGDTVEYNLVTNPRNGKSTAVNVSKIVDPTSSARPERLISRLRTASLDEYTGPKLIVIRKPRGPDGTRGFRPRTPFNPVTSASHQNRASGCRRF